MLRLLHNRSIVKYFLAALGIAFAFYFAWSFYPFGEWVGKHFLQDAPGGTQVLGIVSAAILGGCVLIVVFYKEYIREDTQAYSLATGDVSFMRAFKWFVWFVIRLRTVLSALPRSPAQLLSYQHRHARRWRSWHGSHLCGWQDTACADEPPSIRCSQVHERRSRALCL